MKKPFDDVMGARRSRFALVVIVAAAVLGLAVGSAAVVAGEPEVTITSLNLRQRLVTAGVASGVIDSGGVARSLTAKLDAAVAAVKRGDQKAAERSFAAFANEVRAQEGKHIARGVVPGLLTGTVSKSTNVELPQSGGELVTLVGANPVIVQVPPGSGITTLTVAPAKEPAQTPSVAAIDVVANGGALSVLPPGVKVPVSITFTPPRRVNPATVKMLSRFADGTLDTTLGSRLTTNTDGSWTVTGWTTHFSPFWVTTDPASITTFASGVGEPQAATVTGGGLYVAEFSAGTVRRFDIASGSSTVVTDGLQGPVGVAVSAGGTVYVADGGGNAVYKVSNGTKTSLPGCGAPGSLPPPPPAPAAPAPIASTTTSTSTPPTTAPAAVGVPPACESYDGFLQPSGVALDEATKSLYIAEFETGRLLRHDTVSGTTTVTSYTASGYGTIYGLALDGSGSLYVSNPNAASGGWEVLRWDPRTGATTVVRAGEGGSPLLLAADPVTGHVFLPQGKTVGMIAPDGSLSRIAGAGTSPTSPACSQPLSGTPATDADLGDVHAVAVDASTGRLYLSDTGCGRLLALN